jgi:hypothetical protein
MARRSSIAPVARRVLAMASLCAGLAASPAWAQTDGVIIQPEIAPDYDRGRNVSVTEKVRSDYDALGYQFGSIKVYPRVDLGIGATDNVFLTANNTRSDAFFQFAPSVYATTDWSQHQITLNGGGNFRRYANSGLRDSDEWNVNALGRYDIGSSYAVTVEGQAARVQEQPFSGSTDATVAALSRYRRSLLGIRGETRTGRIRAVLSYDYQDFIFSPIELTANTFQSQANRDRHENRFSGQLEYAFSPSTAAYARATFDTSDYSTLLAPGVANRDSKGFRMIGGLSIDATGFFRGTVGLGYVQRNYASPIYKDVSGFSAEVRLEYFRSELTTFKLTGRRVLQDSNIGNSSAFFDNRVSLGVDHELLNNLILSASAQYANEEYIGSTTNENIWVIHGGARFLANQLLAFTLGVDYGKRNRTGAGGDFDIHEVAGLVGVTVHR